MGFPYSFPFSFPSIMATLEIDFSASISSDGFTVTLEDTSDWTTSGLLRSDYVRTFLLKDSAGQTLDTIILPNDSDTDTYTLTKDRYVSILFSIVGAQTYTKLENYMFDRIFLNKFQEALIGNGCCTDRTTQYNINTANTFYQAAIGVFPTGNASATQSDLDSANAFINLV